MREDDRRTEPRGQADSQPRDETRSDEPRPGESQRTHAAVRRSRWPGWIWLVPIAAVGILAWLGVRFFFRQGTTVTVIFDKAPGVSAQNTQVTYRGVNVGKVSDVALSDDGQHVRVKLSLNRSVDKYLHSGTLFWLQGLSGDLTDLSSLVSAIGGPTVEMEPGPGKPQHEFIGLEKPPAFTEPVAGTRFTLLAGQRGSAKQGSGVYYLGLEVGKVTDARLIPPHQFRFDVLVRSPYDQLVHAGSRFWDAGALELSLTNGLKLQLLSPAALISGAIAFETPAPAASQPRSGTGAVFTLYGDQDSAELAPAGPHALYSVQFPGAVGALKVGAPVKLRDFVVGEVRDVGFDYDVRSGTLRTPVTLELDADRLHLSGTGQAGGGQGGGANWERTLNQVVSQLVRSGLRARLAQDPPLVGASYVSLDFVPHVAAAALDLTNRPPRIPAAPGGGLSAFTTQLGQLPIEQIGANVRQITARVRTLVSSPQLTDSLGHLDSTLAGIDRIVKGAEPQVQPLIASLRRAASQMEGVAAAARQSLGGADEQGGLTEAMDELTRAARSVRTLAQYLERHPEALIEGKRP
ncbi:MAG TPA: MlaD family protein [Steroidobacteraceae bacterium]|nr:MlaD family protein [Steroidobacteraceae bacterium]